MTLTAKKEATQSVGEILDAHHKAVKAAYHAQFELVKEPLGYRARHKVTGQSYQAHDLARSMDVDVVCL